MSKKTIEKNRIQPSKNPSRPTASIKIEKSGIGFFSNFFILIFSVGLVLILFKGNEGYSWVWKELITENLKFIYRNPNLSDAQKYQAKFGLDAAAIDYIKNKTPEDAVILMPPSSVLMNDSSQYKFLKGLGGIKARNWTIYFLYPRKLVYYDELDKNIFAKKISHVVCFGNWGYSQLNYKTVPKDYLEVLPTLQPRNKI